MTTAPDLPSEAPTIESVIARALGSAETLYEEATVAWAAGLPELDFARLRAKLKEKRVAAADFSKVVGDRRRASRVRSVRGAVGEDGWRATLKQGQWGEVAATFGNLCIILRNTYAERLSYNRMASTPCLDGRPLEDLDVSRVRRDLERAERVAFSAEDVGAALALEGAEVKSFHPVQDYLNGLPPWDGQKRLDAIAPRILGVRVDDRLGATMVKRWVVALVARAMNPGEKADNCLVLFSKGQGLKKSTFFEVLGGTHYGDSKIDITNRHGVMVMHRFWVYELAEVDRLMRKHDHADTKAFISQRADTIVPMFGRAAKELRRSFMPCGTTNQERLLTDVTGDRRWWIVEVPGTLSRDGQARPKVNLALLAAWRDQIFAEALHEWRAYEALRTKGVEPDANPHRWWLSDEEEEERERRTLRHRVEDTWEEPVGAWLAGEPVTCAACRGTKRGPGVGTLTGAPRACFTCNGDGTVKRGPLRTLPNGRAFVTSAEVLTQALAIPPERYHAAAVKLAGTMAALGWEPPSQRTRMRRGLDGLRGTVYLAPLTEEQRAEAETRAAVGGDPEEEPLPAPAPTDPAQLEAEQREAEEARAVLARQIEERRAEEEAKAREAEGERRARKAAEDAARAAETERRKPKKKAAKMRPARRR